MKPKMTLYLVRHGESMGNVNKALHITMADHAIPLSEKGKEQAIIAGRELGNYLLQNHDFSKPIRLWVSPYMRTRQTADGLEVGMNEVLKNAGKELTYDRREHINLVEQQFGLFDGIPDEDLPKVLPKEHKHYQKQEEFEGKFWAQMPLGESRFQVAQRVHQAFGTFHRDRENSGISTLIVVSHGVTLRALTMQWLHMPYEWMETERNPDNCSVRKISQVDEGYLFAGFPRSKAPNTEKHPPA